MKRLWIFGPALWLCSTTTFAHHSFAVFDKDTSITIHGTVVDFQWVNPHCWLDLDVKGDDGQVQKWGFEGAPPLMLRNMGVSKDSFKPGDEVVVMAHPRKDGVHAGSLMTVTTASGQFMLTPRGPSSTPPKSVSGASS